MDSSSSYSVSPRVSERGKRSNPNSPRHKKPVSLGVFWTEHKEYRVNHPHNYQEYGKTIRRAMQAGQQYAVLIRIMKNECIVSEEDSVPLTARGGLHSKHAKGVVTFHPCMTPLLEWVAMQGLLWRIGSNVIGGTLTDIHSPWSDFMVYWQPKLHSDGTLMSFWINYCTVKCADGSRAVDPPQPPNKMKMEMIPRDSPLSWYEIVGRAMMCGQEYAILLTLYNESDFTYEHMELPNPMVRRTMTLENVKMEIYPVGNKLDSLKSWIQNHPAVKWCYIVDDAKEIQWAHVAAIWTM